MDDQLREIVERKEFATNAWADIRKEAATDMQYVSGDPWDDDDKKARKGRPTIAPEEMGQYFNQVINQLWANPRGMKFSPVGNGANDKGAQFYQNKAREIEYRSHAKIAYTTAASDAIQRSYGFVEVLTMYASHRSANQELWIEACPDPDLITPDPDALRADSSDMQYCFQEEWKDEGEFTRKYKQAKLTNFSQWATTHEKWLSGNKVCVAKYWAITTTPKKLLLVQPPAPFQPNQLAPMPLPAIPPVQVFEDEIPRGGTVIRELRTVDYPHVTWTLTNGIEVLDEGDWPGKYIPIISCYGKVLYVPKSGKTERQILSMTRFGRAPWKAYSYACSQELEVLSQVPKASAVAYEGQLAGHEMAWQESQHQPKVFLYAKAVTDATGSQVLPLPQRMAYDGGQYLQAIEIVKEGYRRAIQAAMGSNFLPTQAQRRNEKSGVALDKMQQAATTGTFHFVNNYEDMIRQVGVVCEDLMDKIYDYQGETGVMEADLTAQTIQINSDQEDAVSTKGDYLVTVSTGPNSDSEREQVQEFTDSLVQNLQMIAQVSGPKAAAAVLARSIRLRNGGPMMDQLADILEPPEYKTKDDGEPPDPEMLAMQGQLQQLQQQLQQAMQVIETKQVEQQGAMEQAKLEADAKAQIEHAKIEQAGQESHLNAVEEKAKLDAEVAIKQRDQELKAMELELKRLTLEVEQQIAAEKIASTERLAQLDAEVKMDLAAKAAQAAAQNKRVTKTVKRGPGGELIGAEEVHEGAVN